MDYWSVFYHHYMNPPPNDFLFDEFVEVVPETQTELENRGQDGQLILILYLHLIKLQWKRR